MLLKLLYTLILVFCMSSFASSNECTRSCPEGHSRIGAAAKGLTADKQPLVSQRERPQKEEETENTPFQVIKFLYI